MAFFRKTISVNKMLKRVARGDMPRFIDLRGNYCVAIPGSIPVLFDADLFFEEEMWVQDMLGVQFRTDQMVIILCEFGQTSEAALDLFMEKNPKTPFDLRTLKGGMESYRSALSKLTKGFKKQALFEKELTSLSTHPARFQQIIQGLQKNQKSFLASLFQ
ncbi:MAG: rhodanese-like domain-containing protein [Magnetococcales bacterium]|nr:rhodanese-like domain-containing protein [Magnetococcales bacterium]